MAPSDDSLAARLEKLLKAPPRTVRPSLVLLEIEHAAVGLSDEAQERLSDLIDWLQDAEKLADLGELAKATASLEAAAEVELPAIPEEAPAKASKKKDESVALVGPPKKGSVSVATIFTDGGARGNPGPAGIGFVMETPDGETVWTHGETIGKATNNVAEYRALILALESAQRIGVREVDLHLDAELVVKQMTGAYKVKNEDLKPLWQEAQVLTREFDRWSIRHIPRKQNAVADALVNQALDEE